MEVNSWNKGDVRCAHRRKIFCLDWNCSGSCLATGSQDQSIKLWKLGSKDTSLFLETDLRGHTDSVMYLRWHPKDEQRLVSTSGQEQNIRFWDARASKNTATLSTPGNNLYIAWNHDGNYVAVGNRQDVICTVDVRKMSIINKATYKYQVNELAFLRESKYLLQGTANNASLEILNFPDMQPETSLIGHTASVLSVAVDPQEKYIATGGADAITTLWDAEDFRCIHAYYHMENPIRAIAFSHDSKYMSMTGEDPFVYVEDIELQQSLGVIELQKSAAEESCWNPKKHILTYPVEYQDHFNIELRVSTHMNE
mmetsp:Transcript_13133/g.26206  ORF Transcript_13133/g.26206 Transcript_13133/m.26206 type:complete len:311 (+) Transcript_13133:73-1005(+)